MSHTVDRSRHRSDFGAASLVGGKVVDNKLRMGQAGNAQREGQNDSIHDDSDPDGKISYYHCVESSANQCLTGTMETSTFWEILGSGLDSCISKVENKKFLHGGCPARPSRMKGNDAASHL